MFLTEKQETELNVAILQYMKNKGYQDAYNTFKHCLFNQLSHDPTSDCNEKFDSNFLQRQESEQRPHLLELRQSSVARLQTKIMSLERELQQLKEIRKRYDYLMSTNALESKSDVDEYGGASGIKKSKLEVCRTEQKMFYMPTKPAHYVFEGHQMPVNAVKFHPTQTILASASDDSSIRIQDYENCRFLSCLKGHIDSVQDLCFSPGDNGKYLASCSKDMTIKLWQMKTTGSSFTCIKTFKGHDHTVSSIAFHPLNSVDRIFSCSRDATIKIQDMNTGYCISTLKGHEGQIRCIKINSDGQILASCSDDKSIRIWDISNNVNTSKTKSTSLNKCKHVLLGHTHIVLSINFSQNFIPLKSSNKNLSDNKASLLVSGSRDMHIRVWDVVNGRCLHVLTGHQNQVRSVMFHPSSSNSRFVLSCSDDKSIRVQDLHDQSSWLSSGSFIENSLDNNDLNFLEINQAHDLFVTCVDQCTLMPFVASGGADNTVKVQQCTKQRIDI